MHTVDSLRLAISQAEAGVSRLSEKTLALEGVSSPKVRHLINNLCSILGSLYSEVGCWKGSTLCSALDDTKAVCYACDNWSQFGGPREECLQNLEPFSHDRWALRDADCFTEQILNGTTVFFYDGAHDALAQYRALNRFCHSFAPVCAVLVDDFNEASVSASTYAWLDDRRDYRVLERAILPARWNGDTEQWWNGLGVFLLQRQ